MDIRFSTDVFNRRGANQILKVERIMICTLIVLGIIFTNTPIKAASNEASANGVEYPTLEEALEIRG